MARIRTVKPEFWSDERIGEVSPTARLLFIASWNFADDEGGLDRSSKQLKAQAFPYDAIDCEPLVQELIRAGLLIEYSVESSGVAGRKKYLHISGFQKHQKIENKSRPRIPPYEGNGNNAESSPSPHREVAESSYLEGKGSSKGSDLGTRARAEVPTSTSDNTAFPQFRANYPPGTYREANWLHAEREFYRLIEAGTDHDELISAASGYAAQQKSAGNLKTRWILSPQKFLADGNWRGPFPITPPSSGKASADPIAVGAWDRLIESDGAERDNTAQRALDAIGGWQRIRMRTAFDEQKIRSEFCHAYAGAAA